VEPLIVRTADDLRRHLNKVRGERKRIGLVPTMGALHQGHARLIERARADCDVIVVSIFVNPLQFGPNEDFTRYPRTFAKDIALCGDMRVDVVFAPEKERMFGRRHLTFVEVTELSDRLCGPYRPGHFRGVATVVLKLFNLVAPDRAYFGEKDYQQLCIIRRMVDDLDLRLDIIPVATVREADGLAISSRNAYLSVEERRAAPALFQALEAARRLVEAGEARTGSIQEAADRVLAMEPLLRKEYLQIVDPSDLKPVEIVDRPVRIAVAAWLGKTRLIDNLEAGPTTV
jgi:pantoate--beta-alanine ligase